MKKLIVFVVLASLSFANSTTIEKKEFDVVTQKLQQVKNEYNQKLQKHYEKVMDEENSIIKKYSPRIKKLEKEKQKKERALLEAQGKEIPNRLKSKDEIKKWIDNYSKESAEISNRSDSIGSRLKLY